MSNKQKRYLEEKLIHKTIRGEMVRSKSEVIVANILDKININYSYEEPFDVSGKTYIPYFTLHYHGKTAYLEHIGTRKELFMKVWEYQKLLKT